MKTIATLAAVTSMALLLAQPVFAYQLSPPKTKSILTGRLQFVNGGQEPFSCNVTIVLRTHDGAKSHSPAIEKVDVHGKGGDCGSVNFLSPFPWEVQVTSGTGGVIFGGAWGLGDGCGKSNNGFSVDNSGNWTIIPGCLSGTLRSNPPVVIVP